MLLYCAVCPDEGGCWQTKYAVSIDVPAVALTFATGLGLNLRDGHLELALLLPLTVFMLAWTYHAHQLSGVGGYGGSSSARSNYSEGSVDGAGGNAYGPAENAPSDAEGP